MCGGACGVTTAVLGAAFLLTSTIVGYGFIGGIIENLISNEVALHDDTVQLERFSDIPFPLNFTIRVFNITNREDVLSGGIPVVNEVGPYIYKLYVIRDVSDSDEETLEYRRLDHFEFDAEASYPYTEDDILTTVNVPYNAVLQVAELEFPELMGVLSLALNGVFGDLNSPVMSVRARALFLDGLPLCANPGLLGGVACSQIRSIAGDNRNMEVQPDGSLLFSVFGYKDNKPSPSYKVHRGIDDARDVGRIITFDSSSRLRVWPEGDEGSIEEHSPNSCNSLRGTDTGVYPPFLKKDESVFVFNSDICRSVELRYQHDLVYREVPVMRFAANEWLFDNHEGCFCLNLTRGLTRPDGCLLSGAQELYSCVGAWWTFALLALWGAGAGARVYEHCELARDLRQLGVQADHVATWVCIAFHESRFDTAARNPHSGDHGLLQISELYWCGGGKACGLPCVALRDDDIADDVACALRVHAEHTGLQGDGFLAWVVYPQHCKYNTKKYLADCDETLKNASVFKPVEKSRALDIPIKRNYTLELNPSIDKLLPPYISSTKNSGHSRNELEFQDKRYQRKLHVTYFSNIDDLSLPNFRYKTEKNIESSTFPTYTTAGNKLKRIDTNQFKNKSITDKPASGMTLFNNDTYWSSTRKTFVSSTIKSYIQSPPRITTAQPTYSTLTSSSTGTTTTRRCPETTIKSYASSFIRCANSFDRITPSDIDAPKKQFRCLGCRAPSTAKPTSTSRFTKTQKPSITSRHDHLKTFARDTTISATTTSTTTLAGRNNGIGRTGRDDIINLTTTTVPNTFTSGSRISTSSSTTPRSKLSTRNISNSRVPVITVAPRTAANPSYTTSTTTTEKSTFKLNSSTTRHWRTVSSGTTVVSGKTQSSEWNTIFDLYLNTKRPKLTTYKFTSQGESIYRRRIFADGTTSPATPWKRAHTAPDNGSGQQDKVIRTRDFSAPQT